MDRHVDALIREIILAERAMDKAFMAGDAEGEHAAAQVNERLIDDLARILSVSHAEAEARVMEVRTGG